MQPQIFVVARLPAVSADRRSQVVVAKCASAAADLCSSPQTTSKLCSYSRTVAASANETTAQASGGVVSFCHTVVCVNRMSVASFCHVCVNRLKAASFFLPNCCVHESIEGCLFLPHCRVHESIEGSLFFATLVCVNRIRVTSFCHTAERVHRMRVAFLFLPFQIHVHVSMCRYVSVDVCVHRLSVASCLPHCCVVRLQ